MILDFEKVTLEECIVFLLHQSILEIFLESYERLDVFCTVLRHPMSFLLIQHFEVIAGIDAQNGVVRSSPTAETACAIHKLIPEVNCSLDPPIFVLLANVLGDLAVLLNFTQRH